jgi:CheY-like chemotaxis protein
LRCIFTRYRFLSTPYFPAVQKLTCVLLVDDDPITNFLNQELLESLGVTDKLLVAENGQAGLELLQAHCQAATPDCPALVLLDVQMPVLDGFGFLEGYARMPLAHLHSAIIIVMLSSSQHPQDLARARALQAADFLAKPLTAEQLDRVLQAHFARHLPPA